MRAIWAGIVVIAVGTLAEVGLGIAYLAGPDGGQSVLDVVLVGILVAISTVLAMAPALTRNARRAALWWLFLGLGSVWWFFMLLWPLAATLPAGLVTGVCCLASASRSRVRARRTAAS